MCKSIESLFCNLESSSYFQGVEVMFRDHSMHYYLESHHHFQGIRGGSLYTVGSTNLKVAVTFKGLRSCSGTNLCTITLNLMISFKVYEVEVYRQLVLQP